MKFLLVIFSCSLLLGFSAVCQNIEVYPVTQGFHSGMESDSAMVIASAGSTDITSDSTIVSWTIGEALIGGAQSEPVGIGEPERIAALKVYPNPTSDKVTVEIQTKDKAPADFVICLYDIGGKNLFSQNIEASDYKGEVDLSNFPSGQYLLTLTTRTGAVAESFRVQKLR